MTPEQIEQIINMLAEKLGPLGEHVWSVYVRQVYVSTLGDMVGGALLLLAALGFLLGGVWCARRYMRNRRAESYQYNAGEYQAIGLIICGICGPFALAIGVIAISQVIRLFNPEYYAIQMLLGR